MEFATPFHFTTYSQLFLFIIFMSNVFLTSPLSAIHTVSILGAYPERFKVPINLWLASAPKPYGPMKGQS